MIPDAPPSRRRVTEGIILAVFILLAVLVYRAGPGRSTPDPGNDKTEVDPLTTDHKRVRLPKRPAGLATDPDRGSALVLMDQVGGETFAQAREGGRLYFGRGRRLVGYDLAEPKWPSPLGASRLLDAPPIAIGVRRGLAYLALSGESKLHILAVPESPRGSASADFGMPGPPFEELGTVDLEGPVVALAVAAAPAGTGDRLYAIEARGRERAQHILTVVDIADARVPRVLASSPLAYDVAAIAAPPGDARFLYLATRSGNPAGGGGVAVLDVSRAAEPRLVGFVEGVSTAHAISVGDDAYAYVIGQPSEQDGPIAGVMQLDLHDSGAPRRVALDFGEMLEGGAPWSPSRMPQFGAYFADPESFWELSFGLALSPGRLSEKLAETLADRSDASAPPEALVTLTSLDVYGDRLFAISEVGNKLSTMWNLQLPYRELAFTIAETFGPGAAPVDLAADRDYIFGIDGDREDPQLFEARDGGLVRYFSPGTEPAFAGGWNRLRGRMLSLANLGFHDLDPAASFGGEPRRPTQAEPRIAVDGDLGVTLRPSPLRDRHSLAGLLRVLDLYQAPTAMLAGISLTAPPQAPPPSSPGDDAPGADAFAPWDVALKGRYAYVTTQDSLRVVDIYQAKEVGRLAGLRAAGDILVTGGHVYIAGGLDGLVVVDITRPTQPRMVQSPSPRPAIGVAAFDGGIAVLEASGGLSLYRIERPGRLELQSRIEPRDISPSSALPTRIAAGGHSVFLAGPGFVWATSADAPEASAYFEDNDLLDEIQAITAVDGLLYVSDERSGMLVFDHVTAPYWAELNLTVHEPKDQGAIWATPSPAAGASLGDAARQPATDSDNMANDELGFIVGPIGDFGIDPGASEDHFVWLDGPADALAKLGRTVFLKPVDLSRDERVFRFAGRRALVLPPGVQAVDGKEDAEVEVEINWAPDAREKAARATELAASIPPTRTPIPGLPHRRRP